MEVLQVLRQSIAVDCPACGARSPVDSLFCHECGASMSELCASPDPPRGQPHYDRPTGLLCPRCRTANEPGSAYCYSCGLPLDEDLAVAHAPASYARPLGGSPYQSPRTRANWTVGLLVATCVVSGFVLLSMLDVLGMARQVVAGQYVSDADWNEAISNVDGLLALSFALLIATATAFLLWVHRASKNLVSLGAHGQRFSPAWAVGWWFVPIMSFFRPYQVMAECCPRSGVRGRGYAHQGAFVHAGASSVRLYLGICPRRTPRLRPQKAPARRRKSGLGCTYTCRVQLIRCSAANNSVGDSVDNRRSDLGFRPIQVGAGSFSVQVSTKLPTDGMSWLRSAYTDHKPVLPILRNVSCVSARAALLRQLQRREPTRRKLLRWVWRPAATLMTPMGRSQRDDGRECASDLPWSGVIQDLCARVVIPKGGDIYVTFSSAPEPDSWESVGACS